MSSLNLKVALQTANPFSPRTPDPANEAAAILHQRFSILSLLLTLITTINHGHPTLRVVQKNLQDQSDQRGRQVRPHVIEAVLAVLVRDIEVLACMTYGRELQPTGIVAIQQPMQNLVLEDEEEYRFDEGSNPFRLTAIANGLLLGRGKEGATKNVRQGKPWGAFKGKLQGKKLEAGTKDELRGQEANKERAQSRWYLNYSLAKPGKSLWALAGIKEPVAVGVTKDSQ
jgi:hypothetical protein